MSASANHPRVRVPLAFALRSFLVLGITCVAFASLRAEPPEVLPEPRLQGDPNESKHQFPEPPIGPAPETPPEQPEAERVKLERSHPYFDKVIDKREMANLLDNPEEYSAYNYVLQHASQFSPETLAKYSLKGSNDGSIIYADLIEDVREQFLRELIHIEGRLVRIRKMKTPERLAASTDLKEVYEGWIYHDNNWEHPVCVVFIDLPPGVNEGENLSYRVSVDGYYFKLMRYKSQEKEKDGKPVYRVAPVLITRSLMLTEKNSTLWSLAQNFIPMVILGFLVIGGSIFLLNWWLRRDDDRVRAITEQAMTKTNPFADSPTNPAPEPPTGQSNNRLNPPPSSEWNV